MRFEATAAAVALVVIALGVGAPPVTAAGSSSFTDPVGDATGVNPLPPGTASPPEAGPQPNTPELDLTKVDVASDGTKVTFVASIAKSGVPEPGTTFRFLFTHDGAGYQLIAQRPSATFATTTSVGIFFRAQAAQSPELSCRDCGIRYDLKANTVTASAGLASLSAGMKQAKASSKPLAPGMKLTGLRVLAQRNVMPLERSVDVGRTITVDVAHGEDKPLTL